MEKIIRCPVCDSQVDRHDIYPDRNRIYCRRKCTGVNQDFPGLANYELPPPKKIRKPKEATEPGVIIASEGHSIDLTLNRNARGFGILLSIIGLTFIFLGYLMGFTNAFDSSQPPPNVENMEPALIGFLTLFTIIGMLLIRKGIWEIYGGYRIILDAEGLYYGKVLGKKWFKKKYTRDKIIEIRKYLQKVSDRKYYFRIGFFIKGKKKPLYPKVDCSENEINWLDYEFYKVWKSDTPDLDKEADFGEV